MAYQRKVWERKSIVRSVSLTATQAKLLESLAARMGVSENSAFGLLIEEAAQRRAGPDCIVSNQCSNVVTIAA